MTPLPSGPHGLRITNLILHGLLDRCILHGGGGQPIGLTHFPPISFLNRKSIEHQTCIGGDSSVLERWISDRKVADPRFDSRTGN